MLSWNIIIVLVFSHLMCPYVISLGWLFVSHVNFVMTSVKLVIFFLYFSISCLWEQTADTTIAGHFSKGPDRPSLKHIYSKNCIVTAFGKRVQVVWFLLLFLQGKGEVNNPAGKAQGGWRCAGGKICLLRCQEGTIIGHNQLHLGLLVDRTICSAKVKIFDNIILVHQSSLLITVLSIRGQIWQLDMIIA